MRAALLICLVVLSLAHYSHAQLQYNFYNGKCGSSNVEAVIQKYVAQRFATDKTIVAGLLRMMFHDCFVHVRFVCLFHWSCCSNVTEM
jgi:peroxidase